MPSHKYPGLDPAPGDLTIGALVGMMRSQRFDMLAAPDTLRAGFSGAMAATKAGLVDQGRVGQLGGIPSLRFGSGAAGPSTLYFHGGGYVFGSAADYAGLASAFATATRGRVEAVDYRLAPEHPYPAAQDDALAAYAALLREVDDPASVALLGDSAGGGLALSVLIRAREEKLPMPGALVLLSPWLDLLCGGASMVSKAAEDPSLSMAGLQAMAHHYLGADGASRGATKSLESADLRGLPPTLVHVGSREVLLDDAVQLAAAAGVADVFVQLEIWPEMIHVWHAFSPFLAEGKGGTCPCRGIHREPVPTGCGLRSAVPVSHGS